MNHLMNSKLQKKFEKIGNQLHSDDPIILAHYFMISSPFHWMAIEFNETANTCFGYSYEITPKGYSGIWCDFSLDELAALTHPNPEMYIPDVELDSNFPNNYKFSEVCPKDSYTWKEYKNMRELENIEQATPKLEYER